MKRNDRGWRGPDITHMIMCMLSGVRLRKSQKLSCADCACWKRAVRLFLHGVDKVGKLDRVLDEEYRNVVADEVPIALLRVKFDRSPSEIKSCQFRSRSSPLLYILSLILNQPLMQAHISSQILLQLILYLRFST